MEIYIITDCAVLFNTLCQGIASFRMDIFAQGKKFILTGIHTKTKPCRKLSLKPAFQLLVVNIIIGLVESRGKIAFCPRSRFALDHSYHKNGVYIIPY